MAFDKPKFPLTPHYKRGVERFARGDLSRVFILLDALKARILLHSITYTSFDSSMHYGIIVQPI